MRGRGRVIENGRAQFNRSIYEQQVLRKDNSSSLFYFYRSGALQVRQGCIEVSSVEITAPGDVNEARDGLIAKRATNSLFNLMLTVYFVTRHQVL